jgi:diguanylate cyclase (GGDEF)-like protein
LVETASSGERSATSVARSSQRSRRGGLAVALALAALGSAAFALAIVERGRAPLAPSLWLGIFFGVLLLQLGLVRAVTRRPSSADPTQEQLVVRLEAEVAARTRELAEQALHDPLTGLANRRLLDDRLAQALAMAERRVYRGGASRVALFALDLDGFKAVNDELGHGVGDRLLAEVARATSAQIRRVDTLARLGGDEFVVLLTEAGDNEQLVGLAQRLLDAIADAAEEVSPELRVTASLGIARFPDDAFEGAALLAAADRALLLAKNEGKNRIRFAKS